MSPRDLINILCVEDNEDDVILIERALRASGMTAALQRVDNAAAASSALFRQPWDIVLCDYAMPRLSVEDVLAITADLTPDLPVVLLTGMIGDEGVADLMRLGIVDVVLKQRLTTRLAAIVTREVKRYRDQNAHARLLNGVNALLAGFDAASNWRNALLMSLDHMVKSFEASAAVMWEALGKNSAVHPIAYSRCDGRSALDQVSQDLHVGETLISKALAGGTIMMAQRGTARGVDAETEALINDLSVRGFTDIICQPFVLDDAAFGLTGSVGIFVCEG
jgi:CheY-like chemotaxis protein